MPDDERRHVKVAVYEPRAAGNVSAVPPAGVVKTAYAPRLFEEMQRQAAEIHDLKQQMGELKPLNQATPAALQKFQAKDQLVALNNQ
jgi:hypothetical protein